jgi:hypothetical protein
LTLRLRGPLPLALVPVFLTVVLTWFAAREDTYVDQGTSNWETHDSGRTTFVAAVVIELAAVVAIYVARDRGRVGWAIALIAMAVSVVAGLVGLVAISAN